MASINRRFVCALSALLCAGAPAFGQGADRNPSPLAVEIRNIERSLETTLTGAERREAYIKLARLQRLSGNVDAAARAWREAALADRENRDDQSLLESSLCYLALGEFAAASDVLLGVIAGGAEDSRAFRDAHYIGAQIEVFRSGSAAALYALLPKPEYAEYRPAIYYTFWRIYGDEAYRTQVLTEFPDSPEARILQSEAAAALASTGASSATARVIDGSAPGTGKVSAQGRPLWFLYPGRGNVVIGPPVSAQPPAIPRQYELSPAPAAADLSGPRALQTGLFSREENAHASADRLAAKGFAATVSRKPVNGAVYWAVSVAPGEDSNRTIMRLKDAGFEAFPVF
ncbi:MAG: SPOR domain-containing protein [Treponema sp.]|nr:SPOR domain-containing protein [Treponema sp.]